MKKVFLTTVIAVLTATTMVNAQDIRYGVRGGLNFAKLKASVSYDDLTGTVSTGRKIGFMIGGFAEIPLVNFDDKLSAEVGLSYSSIGGKANVSGKTEKYDSRNDSYREVTETIKSSLKTDYIFLNTSLKYNVYDNIFVKGGLYFGTLVSVGGKAKYDGKKIDFEDEKDDLDEMLYDWGGSLGLEYNFNNGMFVNLDYNLGFGIFGYDKDEIAEKSKIDDEVAEEIIDSFSLKNNVLQLGVGYKF